MTEALDQETDKDKKPIPLYRIVHTSIEILVFMVLVAITTLLLQPLQEIMQNRMMELRNSLISRLEVLIGRNIRYDTWGPSLLGTLDIRNIRIYGADSLPVISIARVRISYSLITLIRGGIPQSIRSIQLDRPLIAVDMQRDADLLALFSVFTGESPISVSLGEVLNQQARFRIKNGSCEVITGSDQYTLRGLGLEASFEQGMLWFQGQWNAAAEVGSLLPEPLTARMDCRITGTYTGDFKEGSANLQLSSIAGTLGSKEQGFRIRPLAFTLAMTEHGLALKKRADPAPFDFAADYDFRSGELSGVVECEGFSPQAFLALEGPLKDYTRWLNLSASGRASFVADTLPGTRGIRYDLSLAGQIPPDLLPLGKGSFSIQGSGTGTALTFRTLSLQFPQGHLQYRGKLGFTPFAPQGQVSISNLSFSGTDAIAGEIQVFTRNREIGFQGAELTFGSAPLVSLQGSILLEEQGLRLSVSLDPLGNKDGEGTGESPREAEADGASAVPHADGQVSAEGFWDYAPQYGEIHLVLDSFSVAEILAMVRPFQTIPAVAGMADLVVSNTQGSPLPIDRIRVSTEAFVATDFKRFSYHAPRFMVTYAEQGPVFTGVISGTNQYVECTEAQIQLTADPIALSGYADMRSREGVAFSLSASYKDRPYHLEGMILDRHSISIQGSYGLKAYISMTDFGGYSGYIEAENIPVPYRGQFARLSLMSSIRYDTPDFWYFDLDRLELADLSTPLAPRIALRITGRADQKGASFPAVFFDDGRGALSGNLTLAWDRHFSEISGVVHMDTESGEERYDLEARFKDKRLQLYLDGSNMQVLRFVDNPYNVVASGDLRVSWDSMESFSGEVQLGSLSAVIADTPLHMSGSGRITPEVLTLRTMGIQYGELKLQMPFFEINLPEQRAEGGAQIQMLVPGRDLDMSFTVGMDFKPIDSWFRIGEVANAFTGVIHVEQVRFNIFQEKAPFDFVFSRTNSVISLSGGPQDMIRVQISDNGDFYAGLANPSPIRGTLVGTIGAKTIDVQAPDVYVDLAALGALFPEDIRKIVTISGGFATASIQISGSLGDPDFFGIAQGHSVRLQVPQYITQDIRPVPITVVLQGNEMTFGPIPAAVGSGQGTIAGWFQFARWIPSTFTLTIQVPSESPIPFTYDSLGIVVRGATWGTLNLSMQDFVFSVQGDLAAQDTEITVNTEKLTAGSNGMELSTPFITSIITDITLHAGRKVEFIWPTKEFPILQAYADLGSSLRITSDSVTNHYELTGDVHLRSGEIFYFERSFYLREGLLSFNENEVQFDPTISARAEVRDQTSEGPVTISMIIDNAPLQSFTARFESTPPLSQMEIFSMLGQSIVGAPTEGSDKVQYAFLASTADILAQTQLFRHVQRRIRDFLFLDMFSFRTQLLQNIVSQSIMRQDDTNSSVFGNSFDNTAVFLGKYIGPNVFLQVITSLRYDEYRRDLEVLRPGGLNIQGYTIEPDIGMELHGPLFDIRVNVVPRHPEAMFINDVSCTLTWRRSVFSLGDLFK
ncbi:MAG: translocation/assembly module TamB domain-containing protein [Treponema sp.]|nr:translocation/assembly module TamB domain-containing protein [Treponema sp.]